MSPRHSASLRGKVLVKRCCRAPVRDLPGAPVYPGGRTRDRWAPHAADFPLSSAASSAVGTFPKEGPWVKSLTPDARGGAFPSPSQRPLPRPSSPPRPLPPLPVAGASRFPIPFASSICCERAKAGGSIRCRPATARRGALARGSAPPKALPHPCRVTGVGRQGLSSNQ